MKIGRDIPIIHLINAALIIYLIAFAWFFILAPSLAHYTNQEWLYADPNDQPVTYGAIDPDEEEPLNTTPDYSEGNPSETNNVTQTPDPT